MVLKSVGEVCVMFVDVSFSLVSFHVSRVELVKEKVGEVVG